MADRENYMWVNTIFECSGSVWVKKKITLTISEGSTILRGLAELRLIDQRCQTGLKSTLCSKASATPLYQRLSYDFRYQALSCFFPASEKKQRVAWEQGYHAPAMVTLLWLHTLIVYSMSLILTIHVQISLPSLFPKTYSILLIQCLVGAQLLDSRIHVLGNN